MAEFSDLVRNNFLKNLFSKQKDSEYVKIAVIGKGVVGKSSLTYRFINYELPEGHEVTIEDRYKTDKVIENKPYKIEILDTAGEDDYQQMMDMWINFGEGFLLVFAINDKISFDLIPKKRERVLKGKRGQNVPMILVGNKVDLADKRQVPAEQAKKLAESWGIEYIETSAKTSFNCNEAFQKLVLLIASSKVKKTKPCPCNIY